MQGGQTNANLTFTEAISINSNILASIESNSPQLGWVRESHEICKLFARTRFIAKERRRRLLKLVLVRSAGNERHGDKLQVYKSSMEHVANKQDNLLSCINTP